MYKKIVLKFEDREKIIGELEYEKTEMLAKDTDILYEKNLTDVDLEMSHKIMTLISFHTQEYKALLSVLKKRLNLDSCNELLRLISNKDKIATELIVNSCTVKELEYILAAVVVYNDTHCMKKRKLILLVDEEEYESAKNIVVHDFFKTCKNKTLDSKILKFPSWYFFANKIIDKKKALK